jgi:hypothetical protein
MNVLRCITRRPDDDDDDDGVVAVRPRAAAAAAASLWTNESLLGLEYMANRASRSSVAMRTLVVSWMNSENSSYLL